MLSKAGCVIPARDAPGAGGPEAQAAQLLLQQQPQLIAAVGGRCARVGRRVRARQRRRTLAPCAARQQSMPTASPRTVQPLCSMHAVRPHAHARSHAGHGGTHAHSTPQARVAIRWRRPVCAERHGRPAGVAHPGHALAQPRAAQGAPPALERPAVAGRRRGPGGRVAAAGPRRRRRARAAAGARPAARRRGLAPTGSAGARRRAAGGGTAAAGAGAGAAGAGAEGADCAGRFGGAGHSGVWQQRRRQEGACARARVCVRARLFVRLFVRARVGALCGRQGALSARPRAQAARRLRTGGAPCGAPPSGRRKPPALPARARPGAPPADGRGACAQGDPV